MYRHTLIPIAPDYERSPAPALALARHLLSEGGRITALTVLQPIPPMVAQYIPDVDHAAHVEHIVFAVRKLLGSSEAEVRTVIGHPGAAICDFARQEEVDLIVIASHRPEMADYLLGTTAARVVRHADCAVHVLR